MASSDFWTVVRALLRAARQRAAGRGKRMRMYQRAGGGSALVALGFVALWLLAMGLHTLVAIGVTTALPITDRMQSEANGRVIVEDWFVKWMKYHAAEAKRLPAELTRIHSEEEAHIATEASRLAHQRGGDAQAIATLLRDTVRHDRNALLSDRALSAQPGHLPDIIVFGIVLWWALAMICQGETLDLYVQRQRYPMWEWLFNHPVSPAAVFLAEMVAPIVTSPMYLGAPLFPAVLFGKAYGWAGGIAAGLLVGVPATIALACVGKSLEVWALLRMPPRTRGLALGLMGWFGLSAGLPLLLFTVPSGPLVETICRWLLPVADLPWPPVRELAARGGGTYWHGIVLWWLVVAVLGLAAITIAVGATRHGLVGRADTAMVVVKPARFGREPLYRKELLWLRRDRSALVQALLMPLSLAALQAFNMRGVLALATSDWSTMCGIAVIFGAQFLLTLGPKSLTSEGAALWLATTWPRGLESLLRAKARLWATIASALVGIALLCAAVLNPAAIGQIAAVGVLWYVLARSLADKAVTLAGVVSASGEPEKVPEGLRFAAGLGTFTFGVGIFTRQWGLAITGVVYSIMTAAAMWQNFRQRLPYLWDPWSQQLPPAPTLMHAMIGISVMAESMTVLSGFVMAAVGRADIVMFNSIIYGVCAIIVAAILTDFLYGRGVKPRAIWTWHSGAVPPLPPLTAAVKSLPEVAAGAGLGVALGVVAQLYLLVLHQFPDAARLIDAAQGRVTASPQAWTAYAMMAVLFAPVAEEFLFRGLLYRALDREWGGWQAVIGAAAFFAIYHPVISWLPVAALGAMNAVIFKRSGLLAPAVAAHMAYNAVLVLLI